MSTSSGSTVKSLDVLSTTLPRSAPAEVLTHVIVSALLKKGFESAEAGALAEIEQLLEHHILSAFEGAAEYASLAGRDRATGSDLWAAYESTQNPHGLRRESKRRRKALHIPLVPAPASPVAPTTLDRLPPLPATPAGIGGGAVAGAGVDRKPVFGRSGVIEPPPVTPDAAPEEPQKVPEYAFDWAPRLPGKWTYATTSSDDPPPPEAPPRITSSSLDFVKASVTSGDIPPELGIVNFRTAMKRKEAQRAS